jgi:predicted nucleotidyltransferase
MREEADCVIAILSGNFVQRGSAAVFDAYTRAEALASAGADLVFQLPFPFSAASAQYFAEAGTSLAEAAGADTLFFGASSDDPERYRRIGAALASDEFNAAFAEHKCDAVRNGPARTRESVLRTLLDARDHDFLRMPNDILASEYCAALCRRGSVMKTRPILRVGSTEIPSYRCAALLRERLAAEGIAALDSAVPETAAAVFRRAWESGAVADDRILQEMAYRHLRLISLQDVGESAEGNGGLLERLIAASASTANAEYMYRRASAHQYTNARLRRAALFSLLSVPADALREKVRYLLLLSASPVGCAYLSGHRRDFTLPVITKPSVVPDDPGTAAQYGRAVYADRLYTLCLHTVPEAGAYLRKTPYIAP